jgi:hypothetical protein
VQQVVEDELVRAGVRSDQAVDEHVQVAEHQIAERHGQLAA